MIDDELSILIRERQRRAECEAAGIAYVPDVLAARKAPHCDPEVPEVPDVLLAPNAVPGTPVQDRILPAPLLIRSPEVIVLCANNGGGNGSAIAPFGESSIDLYLDDIPAVTRSELYLVADNQVLLQAALDANLEPLAAGGDPAVFDAALMAASGLEAAAAAGIRAEALRLRGSARVGSVEASGLYAIAELTALSRLVCTFNSQPLWVVCASESPTGFSLLLQEPSPLPAGDRYRTRPAAFSTSTTSVADANYQAALDAVSDPTFDCVYVSEAMTVTCAVDVDPVFDHTYVEDFDYESTPYGSLQALGATRRWNGSVDSQVTPGFTSYALDSLSSLRRLVTAVNVDAGLYPSASQAEANDRAREAGIRLLNCFFPSRTAVVDCANRSPVNPVADRMDELLLESPSLTADQARDLVFAEMDAEFVNPLFDLIIELRAATPSLTEAQARDQALAELGDGFVTDPAAVTNVGLVPKSPGPGADLDASEGLRVQIPAGMVSSIESAEAAEEEARNHALGFLSCFWVSPAVTCSCVAEDQVSPVPGSYFYTTAQLNALLVNYNTSVSSGALTFAKGDLGSSEDGFIPVSDTMALCQASLVCVYCNQTVPPRCSIAYSSGGEASELWSGTSLGLPLALTSTEGTSSGISAGLPAGIICDSNPSLVNTLAVSTGSLPPLVNEAPGTPRCRYGSREISKTCVEKVGDNAYALTPESAERSISVAAGSFEAETQTEADALAASFINAALICEYGSPPMNVLCGATSAVGTIDPAEYIVVQTYGTGLGVAAEATGGASTPLSAAAHTFTSLESPINAKAQALLSLVTQLDCFWQSAQIDLTCGAPPQLPTASQEQDEQGTITAGDLSKNYADDSHGSTGGEVSLARKSVTSYASQQEANRSAYDLAFSELDCYWQSAKIELMCGAPPACPVGSLSVSPDVGDGAGPVAAMTAANLIGGAPGVAAKLKVDPPNSSNNAVLYTANAAGVAGELISVAYAAPAGVATTTVAVSGAPADDIVVTPGTKARMIIGGQSLLPDIKGVLYYAGLYQGAGSWTSDGLPYSTVGTQTSIHFNSAYPTVESYSGGVLEYRAESDFPSSTPATAYAAPTVGIGTPTVTAGVSSAAQVIAAVNAHGQTLVTASLQAATISAGANEEGCCLDSIGDVAGEVFTEAKAITSYISQADANTQAYALTYPQLDCFWQSARIELMCGAAPVCPVEQRVTDEEGTVSSGTNAGNCCPNSDGAEPGEVFTAAQAITSYISQADANVQAYAITFPQLDCFWENARVDLRCSAPSKLPPSYNAFQEDQAIQEGGVVQNAPREPFGQSTYSPASNGFDWGDAVTEASTIVSYTSQVDANKQAYAIAYAQLDCFWKSPTMTLSCLPPRSITAAQTLIGEAGVIVYGNEPEAITSDAGMVTSYHNQRDANNQAFGITRAQLRCEGGKDHAFGLSGFATFACCKTKFSQSVVAANLSTFYSPLPSGTGLEQEPYPGFTEVPLNDLADVESCGEEVAYFYLEATCGRQYQEDYSEYYSTSAEVTVYPDERELLVGAPGAYTIVRRLIARVHQDNPNSSVNRAAKDECSGLSIVQLVTCAQKLVSQNHEGNWVPVITDADSPIAPKVQVPPFFLRRIKKDGSDVAQIQIGHLDWTVSKIIFERLTLADGKKVNSLSEAATVAGVEVLDPDNAVDANGWIDLSWFGEVWVKWSVDQVSGEPLALSIAGPGKPEVQAIETLDVELTRKASPGGGEYGYVLKIGSIPSTGDCVQDHSGNITWDITFIPEVAPSSSSEDSDSSDSSISSSSSGSYDSSRSEDGPSGGSTSLGSDKSTAIVPDPKSKHGYVALFTKEAPEVLFEDFIRVAVPVSNYACHQIDPRFLRVCEKDSVRIVSVVTDRPVLVGARIVGGYAVFEVVGSGPTVINAQLVGTRRGFAGMRFPARDVEQFEANERTLNAAYPAKDLDNDDE